MSASGDLPTPNLDLMDDDARQACLSAYLDGELSAEAARAVTAWLDDHPDELRDVEHQRRVWDLLETYADEPVSDHFADGVFEAVEIRRTDGAGGRVVSLAWYRRPLVAAAAGMVLALGASFALWGRNAGTPPTTPEVAAVRDAADALEAVPAELLLDDNALAFITALDDEHFEAYVDGEYDETSRGG